jgi:predicted ArsR family transcriptional regulator
MEHMNYLNIIVHNTGSRKTLRSTCVVETELFKKLLDREIETSHTAAKGGAICNFIIKPNKQEFL